MTSMKLKYNIPSQLRSNAFLLMIVIAVSSIFLGLVLFMFFNNGILVENMTRDPNAISGLPAYTGFISQTGIFFWSAASAICFFSYLLNKKQSINSGMNRFFVVSGMFTLLLGMDDAFLFHEAMFPALGIPEKMVSISYLLFTIAYLVTFLRQLLKTDYIFLLMAFFSFGISMVFDNFSIPVRGIMIWEDGFKLIGIICWLAYFYRVGISNVTNIPNLKY
jgi:hypothetical protein